MDPIAALPKHLMREPEQVQAKNAMGKDDFLKLLMTQLRNQDPINPMNHEQFATQLAQFSQLEQLSNIGKGIDSLRGGSADQAKLQALSLIGKEVKASGSRVELQAGQAVGLKYLPDAGATPVKASIYDAGGTVVREIDLVGQKSDGGMVIWDGKDNQGNAAATGKYTFRISAVGQNGQAKELNAEVGGKVIGVETEGNQAMLIVDTGQGSTRVELSKISRVSSPTEKTAGLPAAPAAETPVTAAKPVLPKVIQLGGDERDEAEAPDSAEMDEAWHDMGDLVGRLGR